MVLLTVAALQHRRLRSRAQQGRLDRKLVPAPLVSRTRCGRLLLLRRLLRNLQGAHRGCRGQLNAGDGLCRVLSRRNPDLRGPGQPPFARQSGMDSGASQDHLATPGSRPTRRATLRLSRTAPSSAKPRPKPRVCGSVSTRGCRCRSSRFEPARTVSDRGAAGGSPRSGGTAGRRAVGRRVDGCRGPSRPVCLCHCCTLEGRLSV